MIVVALALNNGLLIHTGCRFRWVFCQLEVLRRTLPADIRSTLKEMPKTLDETYEHALQAIDGEMRQYAQRLFQCLAESIRPLRVEELADVLAVRFDAGMLPRFNADWRLGDAEEAILSVCTNLISVVDVDGSQVVQFSHFSVKEFLTSARLAAATEDLSGYHIVPRSAHTILAQACLSVLLQLGDHIDKANITKFPLSGYAAQHWVEHGQFEGVSSTIQVAMEHLFNADKPHFANWVWIYDMDDPWRGEMSTTHPEQPQATPLYYAVLCGFRQLIEHLITSNPGAIIARGGGYYESPLLAAFFKEDIDTASSLLRRGADINVLDKSGMGPLYRASQSRRIDIVRLLLEHNADVNLRNTSGATPLFPSCSVNDMEISRLLLQQGADVNSRDKYGFTPLHRAAQNGHLEVVGLLVESGADVDPRDNYSRTPLYGASFWGHVKVAKLLIQHGADVRSRDMDNRTSLFTASYNGHAKLAELLIQLGTDVDCRDTYGWTPLCAASYSGNVKTVELLIQCSADVSSRDIDGQTPLHMASSGGRIQTAELLIQHGADVGSRDNHGQTSLLAASENGHSEMVELLLQLGPDVNNNGWTPLLYAASRSGHVKTAELLIQHGADVNSPDTGNDGRTPLHAASGEGHVQTAELLIQCGANLGAHDYSGITPLHLASYWYQMSVAELLIQCGADLGSHDNNGQTPLHVASSEGHLKIVELLIRYGAASAIYKPAWKVLFVLAPGLQAARICLATE